MQSVAPDAKPGRAWLDTADGSLKHYDDTFLMEWVPVGEPPPTGGFHAFAAGRASLLPVNSGGANGISIGEVTARAAFEGINIGTRAGAGNQSVAIGSDADTSNATWGVAIGNGASVDSGTAGIAIGAGATALNTDAIAIGQSAAASNGGSIAIGPSSDASTVTGAVAIGYGASATVGFAGVAIGYGASTNETGQVAIGEGAAATSPGGTAQQIAIGQTSSSTGVQSVAIGTQASASGTFSIALGQNASSPRDSEAVVNVNTLELGAPMSAVGPNGTGIIMPSPDGTRWLVSVDNAGAVTVTAA